MADRQDVVVRARVVLGEPADALGRRLPPPVDGLLVIAHAEDRYTPLGQQLEGAQVARVEVLVLVDDEGVVIHAHEVVVGLERLAQQVRQLAQQRVAITRRCWRNAPMKRLRVASSTSESSSGTSDIHIACISGSR